MNTDTDVLEPLGLVEQILTGTEGFFIERKTMVARTVDLLRAEIDRRFDIIFNELVAGVKNESLSAEEATAYFDIFAKSQLEPLVDELIKWKQLFYS